MFYIQKRIVVGMYCICHERKQYCQCDDILGNDLICIARELTWSKRISCSFKGLVPFKVESSKRSKLYIIYMAYNELLSSITSYGYTNMTIRSFICTRHQLYSTHSLHFCNFRGSSNTGGSWGLLDSSQRILYCKGL